MEIDYRQFAVLIVDDEPDIVRSFELAYRRDFQVLTAESGQAALTLLETARPAVIVADQRMPGLSGTEFLQRSMRLWPQAVRIILTGYSDNDALVQAINDCRIFRYLAKPWATNELRLTLQRAVETFHLARENERLMEELRHANERLASENAYFRRATAPSQGQLIGDGHAMRQVLSLVSRVAPSTTTVLIEGETGTGKELVARAIHAASDRSDKLFVAVNCAELSESLLESELFGHQRGAFTGAIADHKGLFEVANGGTLFLDEIGETTLGFQAKLLRVLQEGEVRHVGGARPVAVDTRVVAATNRSLEEAVKARQFRQDLYYRLHVFPIRTPPLRERREDLEMLARHLVQRLAVQLKKPVGDLTPGALALLMRYDFPGNVRELENELERAILLAERGAPLDEELLSDHIRESVAPVSDDGLAAKTREFERNEILAALERAGGVRTRAAEEMGLTRRGLFKKMQRLGMT